MRPIRIRLLFATAFFAVQPSAAWAGTTGTAFASEDGLEAEVGAERPYDGPGGASVPLGPNLLANCTFATSLTNGEADDYIGALNINDGVPGASNISSTTGDLYHFVRCPEPVFDGSQWAIWIVTDPIPREITAALIETARNRTPVTIPTPQLSPPGTPDWALIVNLPTWFWVSDIDWQPATASATLVDRGIDATVFVTATPTATQWDPGDHNPAVTCQQGTPWTPDMREDQTDCSHTYKQPTRDGPITLTTTTTWSITFSCQPAVICAGQAPPTTLQTATSTELTVHEIKPVITQ